MLGFVATDRSHQVLSTFFDEEARLFTVSEAMGDPFACLQIAHSGHRLQAIGKTFQAAPMPSPHMAACGCSSS